MATPRIPGAQPLPCALYTASSTTLRTPPRSRPAPSGVCRDRLQGAGGARARGLSRLRRLERLFDLGGQVGCRQSDQLEEGRCQISHVRLQIHAPPLGPRGTSSAGIDLTMIVTVE